jgi:hypothetical protein
MRDLLLFAEYHNFDAEIVGSKVRVWDQDGEIITSSLTELKIWMGY